MSEPRKGMNDKLSGALNEVTSAMSALNMEPEQLTSFYNSLGEKVWLSKTDKWANHAYAHLNAAQDYICQAMKERDELMIKLALKGDRLEAIIKNFENQKEGK